MTAGMLPLDVDGVARRRAAAEDLLEGNFAPHEHAEADRAAEDLERLVKEDVPRLLAALDGRHTSHDTSHDAGYVVGLAAAAHWLRRHGPHTGLDGGTCGAVLAGLDAMARAAADRLGLAGVDVPTVDWAVGDGAVADRCRDGRAGVDEVGS